MRSTNGTRINESYDAIEKVLVQPGDRIHIGSFTLKCIGGADLEAQYYVSIHEMLTRDEATGLSNRQVALEALDRESSRAIRYTRPLSLIMVVIPDLRALNRDFGEVCVNLLLSEIGKRLSRELRPDDIASKYDQEAFLIVLPEASEKLARAMAARISVSLSQPIEVEGKTVKVTPKIGLGEREADQDSDDLLRAVRGQLDSFRSLSAFISYGTPDEHFARELDAALRANGIATFFYARDAIPGESLSTLMRRGVNIHDRVIAICSADSLDRNGVLNEIRETLAREAREGGQPRLIPVRIDDHLIEQWAPEDEGLRHAMMDRVVADFRNWRDQQAFQASLSALLRALLVQEDSMASIAANPNRGATKTIGPPQRWPLGS